MSDIWWSLPLTLAAFFLARKLALTLKISLLNSLLVAMAIIISILLLLQLSYSRYFAGSQILNQLLQPVVALALPLHEQRCIRFVPAGSRLLASALSLPDRHGVGYLHRPVAGGHA